MEKSFKEKQKIFEPKKDDNNNKNKNDTKVIKFGGGLSIKERLKKMNEEREKKNEANKNQNQINIPGNVSQRIKDLNASVKRSEELKQKIEEVIEPINESISLEKNDKIEIYQYPSIPKFKFNKTQKQNCKMILMIGNGQNSFINSFINIYSKISYNIKFRYSIGKTEDNDIKIFDIKSRLGEKNNDIEIISIPHMEKENNDLKKT